MAGTLGRTAIVPEDILPANTNQALAIIRTKNQDLRFLLVALKSRTVTDFIKKNPTVGAQPNLSLAQVGKLKIPYPARAEQEKIGEFFSLLDITITLHQRNSPCQNQPWLKMKCRNFCKLSMLGNSVS